MYVILQNIIAAELPTVAVYKILMDHYMKSENM